MDVLFREQLESGIIEHALKTTSKQSKLLHYLPHRAVLQNGKICQVFDASAKTKSGVSLNNLLFASPNLINDAVSLLISFCLHQVAVMSDIEKAFYQLVLCDNDREGTCFLWVRDLSKEVDLNNLIYFHSVCVPFGVTSSPFLLNMCFRDHLSDSDDPNVSLAAKSFYVDNLVTSFDSVDEAFEFFRIIMDKKRIASFNLRGWLSNDSSFVDLLSPTYQAEPVPTLILGYLWNPVEDTLSLRPKEFDKNQEVTKSSTLSKLASVYDPLGLVSPCLLGTKLYIQGCWRLDKNFSWTHRLPNEFAKVASTKYFLHIFSDASVKAYTAVAYIVRLNGCHYDSAICFLKLKLHPLKVAKKNSFTPRLELLGVVLVVKVRAFLLKNLPIHFESCFLWTDATTVLHWLSSDKIHGIFIQNRLDEIRQVERLKVRYTRRKFNAAVLPTQGLRANKLKDRSLWWEGPSWLRGEESLWPKPLDNVPNYNSDNTLQSYSLVAYKGVLSSDYEMSHQLWNDFIRDFLDQVEVHKTYIDDTPRFERAEVLLLCKLQKKYFTKELAQLRATCNQITTLNYFWMTKV